MMKAEQVPKECLVAYQRAFKAGGGPADGIAAAINAWPNGAVHAPFKSWEPRPSFTLPAIILPLQETRE